MADLLLDDVPDHLVKALEAQAARNGRSAEEEHFAILEKVLSAAEPRKPNPG